MANSKIDKKTVTRKGKTAAKSARQSVKYSAPVEQSPTKQKRKAPVMPIIQGVIRNVLHVASYAGLWFAIKLNMAGAASPDIAYVCAGMVIFAALFVDWGLILKRHGAHGWKTPYRIGLALIAINCVNAGSNADHVSGAAHDAMTATKARAGLAGDRLDLAKAAVTKNEADTVAKEAAAAGKGPGEIDAEISAAKATRKRGWDMTAEGCASPKATTDQKKLCGKIDALGVQLAAAHEVETLKAAHGQLVAERSAAMGSAEATSNVQTTSGSFGESVQAIAPMFGVAISDKAAVSITSAKNWAWAAMLEVGTAFMPGALGGILAYFCGAYVFNAVPVEVQPKSENRGWLRGTKTARNNRMAEDEITVPGLPKLADVPAITHINPGKNPGKNPGNLLSAPQLEEVLEEFYTEDLIESLDSRTTGSDLYAWYVSFCARKGYLPVSGAAFGKAIKLIRGVTYVGHSSKPKYQLRLKMPQLALVK